MTFVAASRYLCQQAAAGQAKSVSFYHKLPKRIILLRHGESLGNVDETSYANIPDWKIPLTRRGERQSLKAGEDLLHLCKGETLFTYTSPYMRTMETWNIMKEFFNEGEADLKLVGTRQEPRLAEQQFGNFQVRILLSLHY